MNILIGLGNTAGYRGDFVHGSSNDDSLRGDCLGNLRGQVQCCLRVLDRDCRRLC